MITENLPVYSIGEIMKIHKRNKKLIHAEAVILNDGAKASVDVIVEDPKNAAAIIKDNTIAVIKIEGEDEQINTP